MGRTHWLTRLEVSLRHEVSTRRVADLEAVGLPVDRKGRTVRYEAIKAALWFDSYAWTKGRTPKNQRIAWVNPMTKGQREKIEAAERQGRAERSAAWEADRAARMAAYGRTLDATSDRLRRLGLRALR